MLPRIFFSSRSKIMALFIMKEAPSRKGGAVKNEKHQVFVLFKNLKAGWRKVHRNRQKNGLVALC